LLGPQSLSASQLGVRSLSATDLSLCRTRPQPTPHPESGRRTSRSAAGWSSQRASSRGPGSCLSREGLEVLAKGLEGLAIGLEVLAKGLEVLARVWRFSQGARKDRSRSLPSCAMPLLVGCCMLVGRVIFFHVFLANLASYLNVFGTTPAQA
jgi:hypothetical protein